MKKVTRSAWIVLLVFSLLLAACGQNNKGASSSNSGTNTGFSATQNVSQEPNTGDSQQKPASDYPNRSIEIVVPFAPGGSTDTIARILAENVSKYLPNNQPVVVVNKPGGAATIGMAEVAAAKPDGYKLGVTSIDAISIQPHYGKVSYTPDSFEPIMQVAFVPLMLLVKKDSPWPDFESWLEYVKNNPNQFSYGSATGTGGVGHLAMEALNLAAGIQTKHIPFEGRGPAVTALLGGHTQGAIALLNPGEEESLRALFNFAGHKSEAYQDIPLLKEKGFDVTGGVDTGIFAPKGIPEDVKNILHEAFKKTIEDPAVIEQIKKLNVDVVYRGPEEFKQYVQENYEKNGQLIKEIGLAN